MPSLNRASYLVEDDRGSGRYRLLLEARADQAGAETAAVVLHDISHTGLLFEADLGLHADTEIALDVPGLGVLDARTVWSNGCFYGAAFLSPLTPSQLRAALLESKVVWPDFTHAWIPTAEELRAQRMADLAAPEPPNLSPLDVPELPEDRPWPVAFRIHAIVGISILLWAAILGLGWLAAG